MPSSVPVPGAPVGRVGLTIVSLGNGGADVVIAQSNLKHAYWSPYQMLAYHSLSGSGIETGDLLGTGTHSDPVSLSGRV